MKTELERTKEALKVALVALTDICGADNRAYTGRRCNDAKAEIEAILNPPPELETVEVVKWAELAPNGDLLSMHNTEERAREYARCEIVKLVGTLTRPVPQKVERSVTAKNVLMDRAEEGTAIWPHGEALTGDALGWGDLEGKRGTLTFTWQE